MLQEIPYLMSEDKQTSQTDISNARTEEEIADFWDTHSLDEHWEQTREAAFALRAQRRRRITLDPEVYDRIEACQSVWDAIAGTAPKKRLTSSSVLC